MGEIRSWVSRRASTLWLVAMVAVMMLALDVVRCSVAFAAQDPSPAAAMVTPWYEQPWLATLTGIAIFFGIEALKKWPWFGRVVLAGPLADMVAVVLASVAAAALRLVDGTSALSAAAQAFGVQLGTAFGAWAIQQGAKAVAAQRKAAALDAEATAAAGGES